MVMVMPLDQVPASLSCFLSLLTASSADNQQVRVTDSRA